MRPHGRAQTSRTWPRAHAVCDRCGGRYNHDVLKTQPYWAGPQLQTKNILVCPTCWDVPQENIRTIMIPPDPIPIDNPRPEAYTQDDNPISGLGTNIGSMVDWGGLGAAFDGHVSKQARFCCAVVFATNSFSNTAGKRWSATAQPVPSQAELQQINVTRFTIYAPSDSGFWTLGPVDYAFQGSNDGLTWTTLYNNTGTGTVGEIIDITSLTGGFYSYHRINFSGTGGGTIMLSQLVIYGSGLSS